MALVFVVGDAQVALDLHWTLWPMDIAHNVEFSCTAYLGALGVPLVRLFGFFRAARFRSRG